MASAHGTNSPSIQMTPGRLSKGWAAMDRSPPHCNGRRGLPNAAPFSARSRSHGGRRALLRRTAIADMVPRTSRFRGKPGLPAQFDRFAATAISVTIERKYVNMTDVNFKGGEAAREARRPRRGGAVSAPLSIADQPEIRVHRAAVLRLSRLHLRSRRGAAQLRLRPRPPPRRPFRQPPSRHPRRRPARHPEDHQAEPRPRAEAAGRHRLHRAAAGAGRPAPAPALPDRGGPGAGPAPARSCRPAALGDALATLTPDERAGAEKFLRRIIDAGERDKVARLIERLTTMDPT